jgi:hypothetical protein
VRFLESALEGEEEKGQLGIELGQAHATMAIQAQRRGGGAKLGWRGVGPSAREPGARLRPPHCSSSLLHAHRLQLMQWRRCGGGFSEPGCQGASTSSYIKEGTPPTHNTQHTQHTTLHSLTPHSL